MQRGKEKFNPQKIVQALERERKSVGIQLRHNGAICSLCPAPLLWAEWLSVRASDWYSEGLGFESKLVPEFFCGLNFFLSLLASLTVKVSGREGVDNGLTLIWGEGREVDNKGSE